MEWTSILCAGLSAVSAVIVAVVSSSSKRTKTETEKRAERRKKESVLLLQMMSANSALTVGVAMALKHGKCNGEVEEGLAKVKAAESAYINFEREVLAEELR